MDKSIRGLHDQLGLHVVEQQTIRGTAGWCDQCKTIVIHPNKYGTYRVEAKDWFDIFGAKKKAIQYMDYYVAEVIRMLPQADKNLIIEDLERRPDICAKLIGNASVRGFDLTWLKDVIAKSKIALNQSIRRGAIAGADLVKLKPQILGSPRLAYNAIRYSKGAHGFTPAEVAMAEASIARSSCYSFQYAQRCGRNSDALRIGASKNPRYAYKYAAYVDKKSHDVTRLGAAGAANMAYWYAKLIDKCEHPLTLAAAATEPKFAYVYARMVAKRDDPLLRAGVAKDGVLKLKYERLFGSKS